MDFLKRKPHVVEIDIPKKPDILVETTAANDDTVVDAVKIDAVKIDAVKIDAVKIDEKKVKINGLLVKKSDQGGEPSVLDKKIEIKYIKDGRAYRTFVFNLEVHIKDKKLLDDTIINQMKKSFGTSCVYKETEFGCAYGFAGDLGIKIKSFLIDKRYLTVANFK